MPEVFSMANSLSKAIFGVVCVLLDGDDVEKVAKCSTLYTEQGVEADREDDEGEEAMFDG